MACVTDGAREWSTPADLKESYDLIVVGAGISGLSAAWFYRQRFGASARILILDNHDDFGGHASATSSPSTASRSSRTGAPSRSTRRASTRPEAKRLLRELGIDTQPFYKAYDRFFASRQMGDGVFFNREKFGRDALVLHDEEEPITAYLARTPLADSVKKEIARLYVTPHRLPPRTQHPEEGTARPHQLRRLPVEVLPPLQGGAHILPVVHARPLRRRHRRRARRRLRAARAARLRRLRPRRLSRSRHGTLGDPALQRRAVHLPLPRRQRDHRPPARTWTRPGEHPRAHDVRCRGGSRELRHPRPPHRARTCASLHRGPRTQRRHRVEVTCYGRAERVKAGRCVMACWNGIIPHILPEVETRQAAALKYGSKVPLLYTKRRAAQLEGDGSARGPLDLRPRRLLRHVDGLPVSIGGTQYPKSSGEPVVVTMHRTPLCPGAPRA
ncbi:MAG: FAD-dependent oxidoreductase [Gemmatimonadetes bacterium]|nr:FAD-dependent oxidoreductase [Gemmatimonadota bacterium]